MKSVYLLSCLIIIVSITRNEAAAVGEDSDISDNETTNENDKHDYISGVKIYKIERDCAMVGGICVEKNDCVTLASTKGLCPANRNLGVECCYELPIRLAPCKQHLGVCMDRCGSSLRRPSTDCEHQHCCVLV